MKDKIVELLARVVGLKINKTVAIGMLVREKAE